MSIWKKTIFDIGDVWGPDLKARALPNGKFRLDLGPNPGALELLHRIHELHGPDAFGCVSRASSSTKVAANWAWLWEWKFFETGLMAKNVDIFDDDRVSKGWRVANVGGKRLVDDRYECLASTEPDVELVAYCPKAEERDEFKHLLGGRQVTEVWSFQELGTVLGIYP